MGCDATVSFLAVWLRGMGDGIISKKGIFRVDAGRRGLCYRKGPFSGPSLTPRLSSSRAAASGVVRGGHRSDDKLERQGGAAASSARTRGGVKVGAPPRVMTDGAVPRPELAPPQ